MKTNDDEVRMQHFAAVHAINECVIHLDDPIELDYTLENLVRRWLVAGELFFAARGESAAKIVRARKVSRSRRFWRWFQGGV